MGGDLIGVNHWLCPLRSTVCSYDYGSPQVVGQRAILLSKETGEISNCTLWEACAWHRYGHGLLLKHQRPQCSVLCLQKKKLTLKTMTCLSQGFYYCIKHHDYETNWGGKRLFSLHFHITVHHQGSQDWNSSRSGSRRWCRSHGGMFLTGLFPLACSTCSLIEPKIPAQRWNHPQGDLSPLITN